MFNSIRRLFGKSLSLFVTDSINCDCYYFYSIVSESSKFNSIQVKDTSVPLKIEKNKNIAIFLHGNKSLECYYKKTINSVDENVLINNIWWTSFDEKISILYFHVCYGSKIILNDKNIHKNFSSWISYSDSVDIIKASNQGIKSINKAFFNSVSTALKDRKDINALRYAIEAAYYQVLADLHGLNNKIMPGWFGVIQSVGNNIKAIQISKTDE